MSIFLQKSFLPLLILTGFLLVASCSETSNGGVLSEIAWQGFWYSPEDPATRGLFTADFTYIFHDESDYGEISGNVVFDGADSGAPLSLEMSGESDADYNPLYCHIDLTDTSRQWEMSGTLYGSARISNSSRLSGSLEALESDNTFRFYPVPDGLVVPPAQVSSISVNIDHSSITYFDIAASDDGRLWLVCQRYSETEQNYETVLFETDSGGECTEITSISRLTQAVTWGDGRLWFIDKYESAQNEYSYRLSSYSDSDYSLVSEIDFDEANYAFPMSFRISYSTIGIMVLDGNNVFVINTETGEKSDIAVVPGIDVQDIAADGSGFIAYTWSRISYPDYLDIYSPDGLIAERYVCPVRSNHIIASNSTRLFLIDREFIVSIAKEQF